MHVSRQGRWGVLAVALLMVAPLSFSQENQRLAQEKLLGLFKRFDVVLFGEEHDRQWNHDFRLALVRNPAFAETVNDIVLECANSSYQDMLDRYGLDLRDVSDADLRKVWRNTTMTTGVWDSPIYEEFIRAVRTINESLPRDKRIRLIAGDPPIDWDNLSEGEYTKFVSMRDEKAYTVIETDILRKHRKGLVIYGGMHLMAAKELLMPSGGQTQMVVRRLPTPQPGDAPRPKKHNIGSYLKEKYPGRVFSIIPLSSALGKVDDFEGILNRNVDIPYLFELAGTKQAELPIGQFFRFDSREPIGEIMDAVLFFGRTSDEFVAPRPEVERDAAYQKEMERRREIVKKGMRIRQ